jgi:hypothetical protein
MTVWGLYWCGGAASDRYSISEAGVARETRVCSVRVAVSFTKKIKVKTQVKRWGAGAGEAWLPNHPPIDHGLAVSRRAGSDISPHLHKKTPPPSRPVSWPLHTLTRRVPDEANPDGLDGYTTSRKRSPYSLILGAVVPWSASVSVSVPVPAPLFALCGPCYAYAPV